MPTPPASSAAPSTMASPLPRPRRHPLKAGSSKESELIIYLDHGLNKLQQHVDNRLQKTVGAGVAGYHHFAEVEKDLEPLVDVLWVSGSPNLQIPYLLTIARLVSEYLPLFPASPRATFRLLDKLDTACSSLLQGKDADTSEPLPGFGNGQSISTTDKVRLKGIVDRTRLVVARRLGDGPVDEEGEEMDTEDERMTDSGVEDTVKFEGFENNDDDDESDDDDGNWEEVQIAKVYEKTIGELGKLLGGPPIGIITDD